MLASTLFAAAATTPGKRRNDGLLRHGRRGFPYHPQMTLSRRDFEDFRAVQRKANRRVWTAILVASVASFFVLGSLWSYVAGLALTILLPLASYEVLRRWNRSRWLKRFPELAQMNFKWIPDTAERLDGSPGSKVRARASGAAEGARGRYL